MVYQEHISTFKEAFMAKKSMLKKNFTYVVFEITNSISMQISKTLFVMTYRLFRMLFNFMFYELRNTHTFCFPEGFLSLYITKVLDITSYFAIIIIRLFLNTKMSLLSDIT